MSIPDLLTQIETQIRAATDPNSITPDIMADILEELIFQADYGETDGDQQSFINNRGSLEFTFDETLQASETLTSSYEIDSDENSLGFVNADLYYFNTQDGAYLELGYTDRDGDHCQIGINLTYMTIIDGSFIANTPAGTGTFLTSIPEAAVKVADNYANDSAAAAAGILYGQLYHNNGTVRLNITP